MTKSWAAQECSPEASLSLSKAKKKTTQKNKKQTNNQKANPERMKRGFLCSVFPGLILAFGETRGQNVEWEKMEK